MPFGYFFVDDDRTPYSPCDTQMVNKILDFEKSQKLEQVEQLLKYTTSSLAHESVGMPVWKNSFSYNNESDWSIGTSKISRVCYKNSFNKMVDNVNKYLRDDCAFDFADCMFGAIRNQKNLIKYNLKGRVNFSDLIGPKDSTVKVISKKYVLAEPKPSFYPLYVANSDTFNQPRGVLAGRKRYKIVKKLFEPTQTNGNENILTSVEFIPSDNDFNGFLVFHNLRPIELGALLWCMTFGSNKDCYHIIGHAKPFGAGVNQLEVTNMEYNPFTEKFLSSQIKTIEEYMQCFENYMNGRMADLSRNKPAKWMEADSIQKLIELAKHDALRESAEAAYIDFDEYSEVKKGVKEVEKGVKKETSTWKRKDTAKEPLNLIDINADTNGEDNYENLKNAPRSKYQQKIDTLESKLREKLGSELDNAKWGQIQDLRKEFENIYQDLFNEADPNSFKEEALNLYKLLSEGFTINKTNKKKKPYKSLFKVVYDNLLTLDKEKFTVEKFKEKFQITIE